MARVVVARVVSASLLLVAAVSGGCDKTSPGEIRTPPATMAARSIFPNSGPADSGVDVYISGAGFQPGATVTLDGPLANVNVVSSTLITATTQSHAPGTVDAVVTNPGGATSRIASAFTFVPLAVVSISPKSGLAGDRMTIAGAGFHPAATVTVGGVAAVVIAGSNSLTATAPAHASGLVDVVVTNPGGQSATLLGGYTYEAVTLTTSATLVAPGGPLTVSWSAPGGRSVWDWVALFKVGDSNLLYGWWEYTVGATSGTLTLTAPAQPGVYEFRYLVDDGFIDAGRSATITVAAGSGGGI